MRDCAVYRAEAQLLHPAFRAEVPALLLQSAIDHIVADPTFARLRRTHRPQDADTAVTWGWLSRNATATLGLARTRDQHIDLYPGPVTQCTLLHELAHCACPDDEDHGVTFTGTYVALVRRWLGTAPAEELVRALRVASIRGWPKREPLV